MKAQRGFTMFELVVVLVMIGILTAGLVPLLTARHANTMDQGEREALRTAREALITYAMNRGALPHPINSSTPGFNPTMRPNFPPGWSLTAPAALNESYMPWNNPALAVDNFGPYRKYFWYDVRGDLRPQTPARTPAEFCQHLGSLMSAATPPATAPRVCAAPPAVGQEDRACSPAAPHNDLFNNAAFTLVSFGSDGVPDMAHRTFNLLASPQVRNYEHPARPIVRERSGVTATPRFYDDLVVSVSLAELASECARRGLQVAATQPNQPGPRPCPAGQRAVSIINTSTGSADGLRLPGPQCVSIATNTTHNLGCFRDDSVITVHRTVGDCTNNRLLKGNLGRDDLEDLDTNNDGTVRFNCPTSDAVNCTHN